MTSKIVTCVFLFLIAIHVCPGTGKQGLCPGLFNGCCPYTQWDPDSEQCVDTGQNTTQCLHRWNPPAKKWKRIFIPLMVVTTVLANICIAYLILLVIEKYLIWASREERVYANQIFTA